MMTFLRKYPVTIIGWALVIMTLSSFIYVTTGEDLSPGWTSPVRIQDRGSFPLITCYRGELWVAFHDYGEVIETIHSRDGKEWSSPIVLVEGMPLEVRVDAFQWLKRPDGNLWLLWTESKRSGNWENVLYYSTLENDTWTHHEIYRLNKAYHIQKAENTPGGGLVILTEHEPGSRSEWFVQSSDQYLEWNPPYLFGMSVSPDCVDILLDRSGTLWLVYGGGFGWTSFRTSRDGNTWSYQQDFPLDTVAGGILLQRAGGQFVFILGKEGGSRSISFSPDALEWSRPTRVVSTNQTFVFDVTESANGILWGVLDLDDGIHIVEYSDQKFQEDLRFLRNLRIKNEAIFFGICLMIVTSLSVIRRHPIHDFLKKNSHYVHVEKHMQNVQKHMESIKSWIVFGAYAFLTAFVLAWLIPSINLWSILGAYSIFFWILSGFFDFEDEKSIEKWKRYGKIIVPLCFAVILVFSLLALSGYPSEYFWFCVIFLLAYVIGPFAFIRKTGQQGE